MPAKIVFDCDPRLRLLELSAKIITIVKWEEEWMSGYDNLDARTELEQTITRDLKAALTKRGFVVTHSGTENCHMPSGLPDIEASNNRTVLTFEVTKVRAHILSDDTI